MIDENKKQKIENLLATRDNISTWDANYQILDIVIEKTEDTFIRDIIKHTCPICDYKLISHGNSILKFKDNADLKGIDITCNGCKQGFYIHYQVTIPSFENMRDMQ